MRRTRQLEEEKKYWKREEERAQEFIKQQQEAYAEKETYDVEVIQK